MKGYNVVWIVAALFVILIVSQFIFLWQLRQPQEVTVIGYHPSPLGDYQGLSAGHVSAKSMTVADRMHVGSTPKGHILPDTGTVSVAGTVYASDDVCTDAKGGRCLSDGMTIGGFYFTKYRKGCMAPNPLTGTCSCPVGYKATGFHYVESSKQYVYWLCWK